MTDFPGRPSLLKYFKEGMHRTNSIGKECLDLNIKLAFSNTEVVKVIQ